MRRSCLILTAIVFVLAAAKTTALSQNPNEQGLPEHAMALTGLSAEQLYKVQESVLPVEQKIHQALQDAGFNAGWKRDSFEKLVKIVTDVASASQPEIETGVKSVLSDEEYRTVQERILLYNQYADLDQADSVETEAILESAFQYELVFQPTQLLDLTNEQQAAYREMQDDFFKETLYAGMEMNEIFTKDIENDTEIKTAMKKVEDAANPEEKSQLLRQVSELVQKKVDEITKEKLPKMKASLKKMRDGLQKILTPQQKAKLEKMKENMPKSLWKMMPGHYGKERPWRPGANSWQPGMGVPNDPNAPREAKPAPKNREKPFPGTN